MINAALFLLSGQADWITGTHMVVDGRFTVSGGLGLTDPTNQAILDPLLGEAVQVDESWSTTGCKRPRF